MSSPDTPAPPRERQTLNGAILASGVDQAIQFVLPLFAGAVLGLPPWQTGLLVAANALATFMVRPFAGVVVDRADRGVIAGAGAGVFAVGCGDHRVRRLLDPSRSKTSRRHRPPHTTR